MIPRVVLFGVALVGCGSPARTEAGLVAERIRTRIEAAGVVADFQAAGEPVYASEVLPKFYERRLYSPAWSDEHGATRLADDFLAALRRADAEGLRAEDYHLTGIEAVLAAVRTDDAKSRPALAPDRWAELDARFGARADGRVGERRARVTDVGLPVNRLTSTVNICLITSCHLTRLVKRALLHGRRPSPP
jgi:Scaffold domain